MGSGADSRSWSSRRRAPDAALGGLFIRSFFFFLCFLIVFSFYFEWHPVAVALLFCPFLRPVPTLIPSLGACRRLWLLPHRHDLPLFPRCCCWSADHPIINLPFSSPRSLLVLFSLLSALCRACHCSPSCFLPSALPPPGASPSYPLALALVLAPAPCRAPLSEFPLPHHDPLLYTYLLRARSPIAAALVPYPAASLYCNHLRGGSGGSVEDAAVGEPRRRVYAAP